MLLKIRYHMLVSADTPFYLITKTKWFYNFFDIYNQRKLKSKESNGAGTRGVQGREDQEDEDQMGVVLTTATLIVSALVILVAIFSINIKVDLFDESKASMIEFVLTVGGGAAGSLLGLKGRVWVTRIASKLDSAHLDLLVESIGYQQRGLGFEAYVMVLVYAQFLRKIKEWSKAIPNETLISYIQESLSFSELCEFIYVYQPDNMLDWHIGRRLGSPTQREREVQLGLVNMHGPDQHPEGLRFKNKVIEISSIHKYEKSASHQRF
ncbi:hypothetical protein IEQ34_011773 [Dendrobium chrysotoxum]|uniref:Uncharacterized protein n=1 Tax=Dendrobium chrysotoxum TaxID=161865 RepID=A0AAV7GTT0_DENCH|nr:hypothetical protein IEQ34_011773 [Dendrobium chrysotoxum]